MNTDPLAQLRPLHLPEAVGWWPPAPGWWLLAALVLALALPGLRWLLARHKRGRYRRAARAELERALAALRAGTLSATGFAAAATQILRRAALARYPREEVAALSAERWLEFLDRSAQLEVFRNGPGRALASAPYDPAARPDPHALHEACRLWLARHR